MLFTDIEHNISQEGIGIRAPICRYKNIFSMGNFDATLEVLIYSAYTALS